MKRFRIDLASRRSACSITASLLGLVLSASLVTAETTPRYETGPSTDPSGSGRFYMGREISQVMGHQGAGWLERPGRRREEKTDLLLDALALEPGDMVADIGAGTGFFSFPMAERVGPEGSVLAVDIQPEMLAIIRGRAAERGVPNVEPRLGSIDDPRLPEAAVDVALLVDVYHELSHPWEMTAAIARALQPGGRLFVVEYRGEDRWVPIKKLHKMTEAQVRREIEIHPLRWVETLDVLPTQHVVVFERDSSDGDGR